MSRTKPAPRSRARSGSRTPVRAIRALERRIERLAAEREAERQRQDRRLAALRRATDRRLAGMLEDITRLRHHEARAEALARLVAERDAVLAAQAQRISHLEALLQKPTHLR